MRTMPNSQSVSSVMESAFINNDDRQIQLVYEENFEKVLHFVKQNNGREEDAKDVYQEAFIALWKKASSKKGSFPTPSSMGGFLYQVSKNKWLDQLGSVRLKKRESLDTQDVSVAMQDHELEKEQEYSSQLSLMKKAFTQLGKKCQELLTKFYFEKKTMQNIGKEMNLDTASARNQKYRCMKKLKELTMKD